MKGFFGKLFGGQKPNTDVGPVEGTIRDVLDRLLDLGGFALDYDMHRDEQMDEIVIEMSGDDEELLLGKDAQLLDAFQLYVKRVVQHRFPDERANIVVDAGGFREDANKSLIELAEKLKTVAMDRGKPVYFRALPPRDRKVIHQYLASDARVKSRSVGDGLYKKIKIYPAKAESPGDRSDAVNGT